MSGFSEEWLALRAPADRRARAPSLLAAVRRRMRARRRAGTRLRIADLGGGTGGALRALAPVLPSPQHWTVLDDDAALLAAVGRPPPRAGQVVLRPLRADLADMPALPGVLRGADLITASALFDLVSEQWCRRLVRAAAGLGVDLYVALTYDGRTVLEPADPLDATVYALFDRHQRRDKGFGPALGPAATAALVRLSAAAGAAVLTARSDWRLGPADEALLRSLLAGWAGAAREIAPERAGAIAAWTARRSAQLDCGRLRVRVGHRDVLACW